MVLHVKISSLHIAVLVLLSGVIPSLHLVARRRTSHGSDALKAPTKAKRSKKAVRPITATEQALGKLPKHVRPSKHSPCFMQQPYLQSLANNLTSYVAIFARLAAVVDKATRRQLLVGPRMYMDMLRQRISTRIGIVPGNNLRITI